MDPAGTGKKVIPDSYVTLLYGCRRSSPLPSDVQCSNPDIHTGWVAEGILT